MFDGGFGDCAMSDGIHPNDVGFYCMAQKFGDVLEQIFREKNSK